MLLDLEQEKSTLANLKRKETHQRVQIKGSSQIPGDDQRPGLGSQGGGNNIIRPGS